MITKIETNYNEMKIFTDNEENEIIIEKRPTNLEELCNLVRSWLPVDKDVSSVISDYINLMSEVIENISHKRYYSEKFSDKKDLFLKEKYLKKIDRKIERLLGKLLIEYCKIIISVDKTLEITKGTEKFYESIKTKIFEEFEKEKFTYLSDNYDLENAIKILNNVTDDFKIEEWYFIRILRDIKGIANYVEIERTETLLLKAFYEISIILNPLNEEKKSLTVIDINEIQPQILKEQFLKEAKEILIEAWKGEFPICLTWWDKILKEIEEKPNERKIFILTNNIERKFNIKGILVLKNTETIKKICTLCSYKKSQTKILLEKAFEILGTKEPIRVISNLMAYDFERKYQGNYILKLTSFYEKWGKKYFVYNEPNKNEIIAKEEDYLKEEFPF